MSCTRSAARLLVVLGLLGGTLLLEGCGSANRPITGSVGISNGVVLTTTSNATEIQVNSTLAIAATVSNDVNNAGVTWSITGAGSLTNVSTTGAIYVAPTSATGAVSATVTATSVADPTQNAFVTLLALGSPVINSLTLFPANQNIVYSATIAVSGGVAPFTWSVTAGALPAGIALSTATTSSTAISGTPTTTGQYSFTLQAVDANNNTATIALLLSVNAETGCLLLGQYAFVYSGFWDGQPATHAGSLTVDSNGNITGIQDYKDAGRTTVGEALTGTCTTTATNTGTLTLNAVSSSLEFNFDVTPPEATTGLIRSGRMQIINAGSNSGNGLLQIQDSTAFSLPMLAGNFAFGMLGFDASAAHIGLAGRLSLGVGATGALSNAEADLNGSAPLTDAALTGTFTAPDANGRGTASLSADGTALNLAYYIVNAGKLFLIDNDGASGTPRLAGFMTPQSIGFDNSALASATGVLSLWGAEGTSEPVAVLAMGRLSNGNAAGGTVDLILDTASHATVTSGAEFTGASYTVAADGRGTLSFVDSGTTRSFVFYLDGAADGYILEQGSSSGNAGLLEAQSGTVTDTINGQFVGGSQFAASLTPISLIPALYLSYGTLSSSYANGTFDIDPTSGRGLGTWAQTSVGTTPAALYLVRHCDPTVSTCDPNLPDKINLLRFGSRALDASIEWLTQ